MTEKPTHDLPAPRIELLVAAEDYGRFAIGPLPTGHAAPFGNALRRVLLSSIPGAAITRIKISGAIHEFTPIPGLAEDGTQLVLNIKGVRLRCYSERPVPLRLTKQGPGPVFAGDIDAPSTVEIVNPEHYLCTIDDHLSVLDMQFTAERGRGSTYAEHSPDLSLGEIAIDALFSPVPQVNFLIESAGQGIASYERLIIEVWTDRTIKPGDALSHAGQMLSQHFGRIAGLANAQPDREQPAAERAVLADGNADRPIDDLGLSTRTYNSLRRAGITTIGQIVSLDERGLGSIRNLGPKGVEEIFQRLEALGLRGAPRDAGEPPLLDDTVSDAEPATA